jgi:hypothetical protein
MAKRNKKVSKRARNVISGAVLLVPAMLAAATAFMNAASTNTKGLRGLADDGSRSRSGGSSKRKSSSRKRTRKASSGS